MSGKTPQILIWSGATVAVVLLGVVTYFFLGGEFGSGGPLLTITKPVGGTLSASGIRCGTRGADCTASRPKGDAIDLTPEADAGFTFVGYTGDCAPGGRTIMTAPRTCGATFAQSGPSAGTAAAGPTQTLTINPVPTGGTLEGVDILCGTKGTVCEAKHPAGVPVELHPTADAGFTFMGFTGDCVPLGHTQMTGPRTCSATFSLTEIVSKQPPIKPSPAGPSRRGGGEATPQPVAPPVAVVPPVAVPPSSSTREGRTPNVDPSLPQKPVVAPPTDDEFAKSKILEMLKDYCAAEEALDPAGVQKIYPKVNMNALTQQLNQSKYRSVQCTFGDLVFVSLDAPAGKAKVQAPLKIVYHHTILTEKPQVNELIADLTLVRSGLRDQWQIAEATFATNAAGQMSGTVPIPTPGAGPTAIFERLASYIAQMKSANAGFSVEKDMIVGEPYVVRLRLSPTANTETIAHELETAVSQDRQRRAVAGAPARVETRTAAVRYGPHMIGHISATDCSIQALRSEEQAVPEGSDAEWAWQVTPQKSEKITVTVRLEASVEGTSNLIRVFEGDVNVHATFGQRTASFVSTNWQWLWTTVAVPGVGYWYAAVRRKNKTKSRKKKR